jgi:hypothetical protein
MKLHLLEAISSALIVGLGQIIKGETKKGILLLLAFYLFLPAVVYSSLLFDSNYPVIALAVAVVLGIGLWGYSVLEALLKP